MNFESNPILSKLLLFLQPTSQLLDITGNVILKFFHGVWLKSDDCFHIIILLLDLSSVETNRVTASLAP